MSRHVLVVLEATDRDGVRVVLTQHNWQAHQRRHLEIRGHLEEPVGSGYVISRCGCPEASKRVANL